MKKSILYLFLLLTIPSMAQYRSHGGHGSGGGYGSGNGHGSASSLTIVAPSNQVFWLFVDDVLQNQNAVRSIRVNNLWSDEVYIRVELDNGSQDCVGRFIDMKQSRAFSIVRRGNLLGLESTHSNIRPELTMDLLTETYMPSMPYGYQGGNMPPMPQGGNMPPMPQGGNMQPPLPGHHPMVMGMNPKDFEGAMAMLSKESFDDDRLTMAKQVVANNPMTVDQIAQICQLFKFESNKLEFAKFAYHYCVEKNKYFMLNDVFTFDSSKRELNDYIQGIGQ